MILDEKIFGEEHPNTARTYSNLALVLQDLGEYEKAITLLEKAYQVFYNLLGEQHPNTKTVKSNLDSIIRASKN